MRPEKIYGEDAAAGIWYVNAGQIFAAQNPLAKGLFTETHCQLVVFLQQTQGINALLHQANLAGVENIQVMGLPVIKKWNAANRRKPRYYLDNTDRCYYYSLTDIHIARQVLSLPDQEQYRVHPFICGFNPTDNSGVDHIHQMLEWYPGLWQGIGELLLHRAELSMLTDGERHIIFVLPMIFWLVFSSWDTSGLNDVQVVKSWHKICLSSPSGRVRAKGGRIYGKGIYRSYKLDRLA